MVRLMMMFWSIAGTVLAGIAIMVVLAVPSLAGHAMSYIPYAAAGGFIAAIPVAYLWWRASSTGPRRTRPVTNSPSAALPRTA